MPPIYLLCRFSPLPPRGCGSGGFDKASVDLLKGGAGVKRIDALGGEFTPRSAVQGVG